MAGGLLTFGTLSFAGVFDDESESREGLVRIPRSIVSINALNRVRREDIYDLSRGEDSYFWMSKERIEAHPEWITRASDIVGRVMARDKESDLVFTQDDFLPEGSRTGLSAGIPEGKQGFFVDADTIPGLQLLKRGDTFDLLASLPDEAKEKQDAEFGLLAGGIKVRGGKPVPLSGVRVLVRSGTMVAITRGQEMTTQGSMAFPETQSRANTAEGVQVTIAIAPEEVAALTQSIAAEMPIRCVAGSGQTDSAKPTTSLPDQLATMVSFPASATSIPAFTRINADHLGDPETGELRRYYFPPAKTNRKWIANVDQLIGRTVSRDVGAGFIFSEDDFAPAHTVVRPVSPFTRLQGPDLADARTAARLVGRVAARMLPIGTELDEDDLLPRDSADSITGGIPVGRMAIAFDTSTVQGVASLSSGDRFDLVTAVPYTPGDAFKALGAAVKVSSKALPQTTVTDRARATVLASAATVVAVEGTTATVAVRPEEVKGITKAITLGEAVFALARSGRADRRPQLTSKPGSGLTSDADPISKLTLVEEIVGGRRTFRVFARDK